MGKLRLALVCGRNTPSGRLTAGNISTLRVFLQPKRVEQLAQLLPFPPCLTAAVRAHP
jgi:hypothetical protein